MKFTPSAGVALKHNEFATSRYASTKEEQLQIDSGRTDPHHIAYHCSDQ
jgi:hypothetical protein